jgi:hypothetical protein
MNYNDWTAEVTLGRWYKSDFFVQFSHGDTKNCLHSLFNVETISYEHKYRVRLCLSLIMWVILYDMNKFGNLKLIM